MWKQMLAKVLGSKRVHDSLDVSSLEGVDILILESVLKQPRKILQVLQIKKKMTKVWCLVMLLLSAPFAGLLVGNQSPEVHQVLSSTLTNSPIRTNSLALDLQNRLDRDITISTSEMRYLQNLERATEHGSHFAWLLA